MATSIVEIESRIGEKKEKNEEIFAAKPLAWFRLWTDEEKASAFFLFIDFNEGGEPLFDFENKN